tara:strand:- start:99 stop:806 length:708 start_codon:yes stop_codon:yes gene_type:complete
MALPKLNAPTYELVLPSTGEKIKFRPFIVREQKTLLIAQESSDERVIADAIGQIVKSCTFDKIDPKTSPLFDIEFLFLRIRGKSVGETANLMVTCPDDGKTQVKLKVNIEDINVHMTADHTNEVKLNDEIKLFMRYPVLADMRDSILSGGLTDKVFNILNTCIERIEWGEKTYHRSDITKKELDDFIDSMNNEMLDNVIYFFDTSPKIRHVVEVVNPKTNIKSEVVLEGLQNFLE